MHVFRHKLRHILFFSNPHSLVVAQCTMHIYTDLTNLGGGGGGGKNVPKIDYVICERPLGAQLPGAYINIVQLI